METYLSPLQLAAQAGDISTFNALPRPLPDNRCAGFFKVLLRAIEGDSASVVRWLFNNDAIADRDELVEFAVRAGAFQVLDMLFTEYGCDINRPLDRHTPPVLRYAIHI